MMEIEPIDISIVLNIHDEARFLDRTLASLVEAVRYAQQDATRFELIVVADRPTAATLAWTRRADFSAFDRHQIAVVDNGNLGGSRSDGVALATGAFISTADGDDLVSYNFFSECLQTARQNPAAVVIPQYLYAFGALYYFWQYFGSDVIPATALADYHAYHSRIFVSRDVFDDIAYLAIKRNPHFAYEDWHLNCQMLAAGRSFVIAKNAVLFYRRRSGSIMTHEGQAKLVPYSQFFSRDRYLHICKARYESATKKKRLADSDMPRVPSRAWVTESKVLLEVMAAANKIDAGIIHARLHEIPIGFNFREDDGFGLAYYEALKSIDAGDYSDVVLLPFLSTGGAEKFLLDVVRALRELDPSRKALVLTGEKFLQHSGVENLPEGACFVDLYRIADLHRVPDIDTLTLRVIQAFAPGATVHFSGSPYAHSFVQRYAAALEGPLCYYYFCEAVNHYNDLSFTYGYSLNFLSEALPYLDTIVSDHSSLLRRLELNIDVGDVRLEPLYARTAVSALPRTAVRSQCETPLRLLWASRLDGQKRPDLAMKIAAAAKRRGLQLHIDMYGGSVFGHYSPSDFDGQDNVRYHGAYKSFGALPLDDYDALLYTASFDGLPNVVLESLSHGLPVIAPSVGGIPEAIHSGTGLLVEDSSEDEVLVDNYLAVIEQLIRGEVDLPGISHKGINLLQTRHSHDAYLSRVAAIFLGRDAAAI